MAGTNTVGLSVPIQLVPYLDNSAFSAVTGQIRSGIQGTSTAGGGSTGSSSGSGSSSGLGNFFKVGDMMKSVTGAAGGGEGGGMGGMGGKAGVAMAAVSAGLKVLQGIFDFVQKIFQLSLESSPLLRAAAKLFQTATMLVFMPLGNTISRLLMPYMLSYMQKAAKRASTYNSSTSIEEITANTITDSVGALADVLGMVLTQVLPGILTGGLEGLFNVLTKLINGEKVTTSDFNVGTTEAVTRAQKYYSDTVTNSTSNMLQSAEGYIRTIDQFGLTMQTANNDMGTSSTDLATTFWHGAETIEYGATSSMTILIYGTTNAINEVNKMIKDNNAAVTTSVNNTTGLVETSGVKLDAALDTAGASYNEAIDFTCDDMDDLNDQMSTLGGGFNDLAATIPAVIRALWNAQRDITNDHNGVNTTVATSATWKNTGMSSVDLSHKYGGGDKFVAISKDNSEQMALLSKLGVQYQDGMALLYWDNGYEILDSSGKPINYGLFGDLGYSKTLNKTYGFEHTLFQGYEAMDLADGSAKMKNGDTVWAALQSSGFMNTPTNNSSGSTDTLSSNSTDTSTLSSGASSSYASSATPSVTGDYIKNNNSVTVQVHGSIYAENELKDEINSVIEEHFKSTGSAY